MARAPSAARFEALYRACYQDLLGYALRRVERPESAADVVADTFLIAWRRIDEIPDEQARPWLFGVARNVMANHQRADRRRADLGARLRQELIGGHHDRAVGAAGDRPRVPCPARG